MLSSNFVRLKSSNNFVRLGSHCKSSNNFVRLGSHCKPFIAWRKEVWKEEALGNLP